MYKNYFFDLYGTLVDIRTDERKLSLWRSVAEFYSLCGASYTPAEIHSRYLALCAEETELLAVAHPTLGTEGVEIELLNVFRRLFEEKGVPAPATQVEDTAVLFRLLSFSRKPRLMKGVKRTLTGLRQQGAVCTCCPMPKAVSLYRNSGALDYWMGFSMGSTFPPISALKSLALLFSMQHWRRQAFPVLRY